MSWGSGAEHVCPSGGPWCSCGGGVGRIALPRRFQVVSSVGSRVPGNLLHQCPVTCQARPSCGHCSGHWLEPAAGRVSPAAGDKIMWHPSPLLVSADIILTSHHHVPAKSVLLQVKHDMFPQINQKCCRHLLTTNRHVYVNVSKRTQYFHVDTYLRDLVKESLQFKTRQLMLSTWWHFHSWLAFKSPCWELGGLTSGTSVQSLEAGRRNEDNSRLVSAWQHTGNYWQLGLTNSGPSELVLAIDRNGDFLFWETRPFWKTTFQTDIL